MLSNSQKAFLELVRAGLWEKEVHLLPYGEIDFNDIYRLAQEQSVVGLVTAGIEHVVDVRPPKEVIMTFVGNSLQLEQRNNSMNAFIAVLIEKMRRAGISALLVKGQGIAQTYERPLWRASGDIDLLIKVGDYNDAKFFLTPFASKIEGESKKAKHLELQISNWIVELHGTLHSGLSKALDKRLDTLQNVVFEKKYFRVWQNDETEVFLPRAEEDIIYTFVHILQHFYNGGIGLRQICDWSRLVWTYYSAINIEWMRDKLYEMHLYTEWDAFASLAVDVLGMPEESMFFCNSYQTKRTKVDHILHFVLETGNFGHNRDLSYYSNKPYLFRKVISFGWRIRDLLYHAFIFPLDFFRFFPNIIYNGVRSTINGE